MEFLEFAQIGKLFHCHSLHISVNTQRWTKPKSCLQKHREPPKSWNTHLIKEEIKLRKKKKALVAWGFASRLVGSHVWQFLSNFWIIKYIEKLSPLSFLLVPVKLCPALQLLPVLSLQTEVSYLSYNNDLVISWNVICFAFVLHATDGE